MNNISPKRRMPLLAVLLSIQLVLFSSTLWADNVDEEKINNYVSAFWNSFNTDLSAGALDSYLSHWDENAERITPTVHAKGMKEIRATYESYLLAFSDFHQTELRRVVEGNVVVSELMTRAKNRKTGVTLSLPNVAILEINEKGKVMRARVYLDTAKFNPQPPEL